MSNVVHGLIDGAYFCGIGRTQELNNRIAERNIPSGPLQPQFSTRPVSTKYALLPILDRRPKSNVPIKSYPTYNSEITFNPGSAFAPWSGFATNINEESKLRNQFFALQKCEQSQYVPSSKSDMYQVQVTGRQVNQPFPDLFTEPTLGEFNPNSCNVGGNLFANCTRQQLKNV